MGSTSFSAKDGPASFYDNSSTENEKNRPSPRRQTSSFFPWLNQDPDAQKFTLRKLTRFPVLGAAGLFGSLCTIVLSYLTLRFFNKMPVDDWGKSRVLPKPAAFLSVILSLNTLMVHLAISQGIAVSWWVRASHKKATVGEMHNIWTSSSLVEAILAWKVFNYVALATVFVATLPVNGVFLQNALTNVRASINQTPISISYNFANRLPMNWTSASLNGDGTVGIYDNPFSNILSDVMARNFSGSVITKSNLTNCKGTCKANLIGLGFSTTCLRTRTSYAFLTDEELELDSPSLDLPVLSVKVLWDVFHPNTIGVNVVEKDSENCIGEYMVTNCTLEMGPEYYSTRVVFNATGNNNTADYTWNHDTGNLERGFNGYGPDWRVPELPFTPYPIVPEMEWKFDEASNASYLNSLLGYYGTRFGGIATALQAYYNSSITVQYKLSDRVTTSNILVDGQFAKQRMPYWGDWKENGHSDAPTNCSANVDYGSEMPFTNTVDDILSGIKSTFFFTSIMLADTKYINYEVVVANKSVNWDVIQEKSDSSQSRTAVVYKVIWKWYFGSIGVTIGVILFVLPTFWGFWTLTRRTTLSPFETARAFHAPVIQDAPAHLNTKQLLKTVGDKNLHTDLVQTPVLLASPPPLHHGYNAPVGYFPNQQFPPPQHPTQQPQQSPPQQYPQRYSVSQQYTPEPSSPPQSPPHHTYNMPIQPLPPQGYTPMPYPSNQH